MQAGVRDRWVGHAVNFTDIDVRALGELASLMPELNLTALIAVSPARVFIAV